MLIYTTVNTAQTDVFFTLKHKKKLIKNCKFGKFYSYVSTSSTISCFRNVQICYVYIQYKTINTKNNGKICQIEARGWTNRQTSYTSTPICIFMHAHVQTSFSLRCPFINSCQHIRGLTKLLLLIILYRNNPHTCMSDRDGVNNSWNDTEI